MDWMTFLCQLFSSAIWPATVLIIAWRLRPSLSDLILALRRLKWGDVEAEFGRDIEHLREIAENSKTLVNPPATNERFPTPARDFLVRLSELSPRSVILESWLELENAAQEALRIKTGDSVLRRQGKMLSLKALMDASILDDASLNVFLILQSLRNRAAHERDFAISKEDAIEYALTSQKLARSMVSISNRILENQK